MDSDNKSKETCLWDREEVPRGGWECLAVEDLREQGEDYEDCEMCGREQIRFVHVMAHPDYPETVRAGCVCAGRMQGDRDAAETDDRAARNRAKRRENYLRQKGWKVLENGDSVLRYKGKEVSIIRSGGSPVEVRCEGKSEFFYKYDLIADERVAAEAAFELYERVTRGH